MKYFLLFVAFISGLFGHGQYKIVDAQTNEPIPFAHITLRNSAAGTTSTYEGIFSISSELKPTDTLIFSCIGYAEKAITVGTLQLAKVVKLQPTSFALREVVINANVKYRTRKLGIKRRPFGFKKAESVGRSKNGQIKANYIANKYGKQGWLKQINVFVTDKGFPDAYFRIHVYACDSNEIRPAKELTRSNIIVNGEKGNDWVRINMEDEYIPFNENGCFVAIEWFDSPSSKAFVDTAYQNHLAELGVDSAFGKRLEGNGAVIGGTYLKYKKAKNVQWDYHKGKWFNRNLWEAERFGTFEQANGKTYTITEDNLWISVLTLNIEVEIPR